MPYIEPNSDIYLLSNVALDPTYENTVWFEEVYGDETPQQLAALRDIQTTYFRNKRTITLAKQSYTRRGRGYIRAEVNMASALNCNYLMFKNTSFENKWFYAFITKVEYVNNITTDIYFDIDVLQTWYFDYTFEQFFVERQHSLNPTLVPENIEVGDYVVNDFIIKTPTPCIVLATTEYIDLTDDSVIPVEGHVYYGRTLTNGTYYSGVTFYLYNPLDPTEVRTLNTVLEKLTEKNKIGSVISLFMGAREIFDGTSMSSGWDTITISKGSTIDNYYPRNKKLFQYPYNFAQVSNFMGEKTDLRFELSTARDDHGSPGNLIKLNIYGNKTTRPALIIYPLFYRGFVDDFENIVTTECFPLCSYNNDTFKAWLAQNQGAWTAMVGTAVVNSALSLSQPINAAGGLPGGGALASVENLAGWLGKAYDQSTLPPTNHGNGNGDVMYQAGLCGFGVYRYTIKNEIAIKLDTFFDMFGYAINQAMKPFRMVMRTYTYIKTKDCTIKGNLPADDKKAIEALYNKGIRYWKYERDGAEVDIGNYSDLINPNYFT